jgi:hypothetical protein
MVEKLQIDAHKSPIEGSATQHLDLVASDGNRIIHAEVYKGGYYSLNWHSSVPPAELTEFAEECTVYYEGLGISEPNDANHDDVYYQGIILYSPSERKEFPYERPLNWEHAVKMAGTEGISWIRFNTPFIDFGIHPDGRDQDNIGVITHMTDPEGLSIFLEKSTTGLCSKEDAKGLIEEIVRTIPTMPPVEKS